MHNPDPGNARCRIVVDAMGGDFAPYSAVTGAIQAATENSGIDLFLVGKTEEIKKIISANNLTFRSDKIINANEIIGMSDQPTAALKVKPDSSIVLGAKFVKEKNADAFVSAGNTGAVMAAATLIIGRIPGVGRPTIGQAMPNEKGVSTLFDVGASVDSKPKHLLEYALMGTIFTREMF
jgi:glycerol-3-phosphate acyltransferase PlsX